MRKGKRKRNIIIIWMGDRERKVLYYNRSAKRCIYSTKSMTHLAFIFLFCCCIKRRGPLVFFFLLYSQHNVLPPSSYTTPLLPPKTIYYIIQQYFFYITYISLVAWRRRATWPRHSTKKFSKGRIEKRIELTLKNNMKKKLEGKRKWRAFSFFIIFAAVMWWRNGLETRPVLCVCVFLFFFWNSAWSLWWLLQDTKNLLLRSSQTSPYKNHHSHSFPLIHYIRTVSLMLAL